MQYINVINKLRETCPSCNGNGCKKCEGTGIIIVRREEEIPLDVAIKRTDAYNRGKFNK